MKEGMFNILIVEDHKDFREIIKDFIIANGVKADIFEAATGEEGVHMASRQHPRVVIMDVNLGNGINGLQAATLIKRQDPSCGIILMGVYAMKDMKDFCKNREVEDFIDKSDVDTRLIPAITRLLG